MSEERAKTKFDEKFEVYAVVDQYGDIVSGEFDSSLLVFIGEADAVDNCDTDNGEQVVRVKGDFRYKVKL